MPIYYLSKELSHMYEYTYKKINLKNKYILRKLLWLQWRGLQQDNRTSVPKSKVLRTRDRKVPKQG